jgi:hypothetical protein
MATDSDFVGAIGGVIGEYQRSLSDKDVGEVS